MIYKLRSVDLVLLLGEVVFELMWVCLFYSCLLLAMHFECSNYNPTITMPTATNLGEEVAKILSRLVCYS